MIRRAFTLLEILVSVSVIATLIGVLLPAFGGARESGRSIACASNLRQLQLASDLYAEAHRGRYAPGAANFLANLDRWHGARSHASEAFDASRSPLAPYLDGPAASTALRECPTFTPAAADLADARNGFERSCGGYGYNNAFVGVERVLVADGIWDLPVDAQGNPLDRRGAARARFAQPARTAAFADAALAHDRSPASLGRDRVIEYSFIEPPRWPQWPSASPDPSVHFRHAGRANVAWLDGHVSAEFLIISSTSGIYARTAPRSVGWFASAENNSMFDYD